MALTRRHIALLDDPVQLATAYRSSSLAELAARFRVSASTVRRALVRHGIARLPRNRNRRPPTAQPLDDPAWLRERYRTASAVDIANELGVTSRTVYAAMDRHGIERRTEPGTLKLRRPQLADDNWLHDAVERGSSTTVAVELEVSAGTRTAAYERAETEPASTTKFYERQLRWRPVRVRSAEHHIGSGFGRGPPPGPSGIVRAGPPADGWQQPPRGQP